MPAFVPVHLTTNDHTLMYKRIRKTTKDEAYYREFIKARVVVDARGCWLWQGFVAPPPNEYGQCYALGRNWRVHRLAYMLWKGAPDPALDVCHECDVKHCCNPDHLWQGTPKARAYQRMARLKKRSGSQLSDSP